MFGTIIDQDKNGKVKLDPKYFNLCPELFDVYKDKNLGGSMIKWIVNVFDRKSIYRNLPLDVRKEDVALSIWGKKDNKRISSPKVQKAIELYKYVMYDPVIAEYEAVQNKHNKRLEIYNSLEATDENMSKIHRYEKEISAATKNLEDLKERIQAQEEERQILGDDTASLSYIEEKLLKRQREMHE